MGAVETDIRLTDPASMACPFENYARLHAQNAAHEEPGLGWVVTKYADVQHLSKDTATFSNHWHGIGAGMLMMGQGDEPFSPEVEERIAAYPHQMPNGLLLADAPVHTRHRALVLKALNARRIREFEPQVHVIVNRLIDDFIDDPDGHVEFMHSFGELLPSYVSAEILGLPPEDVPELADWTERFMEGFLEPIGNDRRLVVGQAVIDFQTKMLELIGERRERRTDDLLSDLVYAELEDGEELDGVELEGAKRMDDPELLSILILLFTGGSHTTMGLLGNAMVLLCEDPDLMAKVRNEPGTIPAFLEEALRIESPVQSSVRRMKHTGEQFGCPMKPNERVIPMWGAANSDPAQFENPREFDIDRPHIRRHMAFGQGPHFCVGAALARAEARIGYETLLKRMDNIRFASDDGAGGPPHALAPSMSIRMQRHVHLQFDKVS